MRLMTIALAAVPLFGTISGAMACDPRADDCLPSRVIWPFYTQNGQLLGQVEAPVRLPPRLETSRWTGQPLTFIYNSPSRYPGSVDPDLHLERLPRARRSDTIGAYPVGY